MSESAIWWYAGDGQAASGPYTGPQLNALHAAGALDGDGRVWSAQTGAWRSLKEHLRRPARPGPQASGFAFWGALAGVTAAFWILFAALIDFISIDGTDRIPVEDVWFVWPGVGFAVAAATLMGARLWWRFASGLRNAPERAGAIKIAAVILTLVGLAGAAQELRQAEFAARAANHTANWTYNVRVDPVRRRLVIKGYVGPRFGAAVKQGLAGLKDPVTVEITSHGGLIREALRAADAIQARPGSTVIIRGRCASACLVVVMAGANRLADDDAFLGFHAAAPAAVTQDKLLNWSMANEGRKSDAYLRKRGVPAGVVETTNRLGPSRLNNISAIDAVNMGILTGLVDGDEPVSPVEAHARRARRAALAAPPD